MKLGVSCDQHELGADPGAIREFALAAEEVGYDYLMARPGRYTPVR